MVCIVLVFTKFHFFFSFSVWALGAFVLWILSLPTEFLFKLCPGQVHQPRWLQWWPLWLEQRCPSSCGLLTTKVMLKKCLQPECQALRTVKNKTPGVQLLQQNCTWAWTKILKKYTRRESLFLKLHSFTAAALKVFPNWSSSWCCWSAGQNAVYMESKSTLKV